MRPRHAVHSDRLVSRTNSLDRPNRVTELTKNSKVDCVEHGLLRPTFVCRHLLDRTGVGFNTPDDPPDSEWPFKQAWCDECDKMLMRVGEWNDESEGFAGITMICENCYEKRRLAAAK